MATVYNTSSPLRQSCAATLGDQHCGDAWFAVLFISKAGCAVTVFFTLGRLIGNPRTSQHSCLLVSVMLLNHRNTIAQVISQRICMTAYLYVAVTFLLQVCIALLCTGRQQKIRNGASAAQLSFLNPMLFPCRTTHTRLSPTRHSFSYSYLLVGVPVGWEGVAGELLSTSQTGSAWFSACADDYLARGSHRNGLVGKLRDYLTSQGVHADRYPCAYLITAPRFLGFSFNPVSFWYLYDNDTTLSAMILEVNNTFDERRMYFLEREVSDTVDTKGLFINSWPKDFHVSPFNDRSGSYSLTARDFTNDSHDIRIDNKIVLRDDNHKPKIVARVSSTEVGVDPTRLPKIKAVLFLVRWWWVGFLTNPRILREARVLWFKKLQLYYRPEVIRTSIGRNETVAERSIEPFFEAFLLKLVNSWQQAVIIHYRPAAGPSRGTVRLLRRDGDTGGSLSWRSLDVHVLTPAFYSEIVRQGSMWDVFQRVCFQPANGEAMLNVSDRDLLRQLLQKNIPTHDNRLIDSTQYPFAQYVVSTLREGGTLASSSLGTAQGVRRWPTRSSDFDNFVALSLSRDAYKAYLKTVRTLLLTDRFAFGFAGILWFYRSATLLAFLIQVNRVWVSHGTHKWETSTVLSLIIIAVCSHTVNACLSVNQPLGSAGALP